MNPLDSSTVYPQTTSRTELCDLSLSNFIFMNSFVISVFELSNHALEYTVLIIFLFFFFFLVLFLVLFFCLELSRPSALTIAASQFLIKLWLGILLCDTTHYLVTTLKLMGCVFCLDLCGRLMVNNMHQYWFCIHNPYTVNSDKLSLFTGWGWIFPERGCVSISVWAQGRHTHYLRMHTSVSPPQPSRQAQSAH